MLDLVPELTLFVVVIGLLALAVWPRGGSR